MLPQRNRVVVEFNDPSLTEQEHTDSCDINKMIRNAMNGHEIRGSHSGTYGYDDMSSNGLDHRIQKAKIEAELAEISENHEFSDEEIKAFNQISPDVASKIKLRKKGATQTTNQTTNQNAPQSTQNPDPATTLPNDPKSS